MSRSARFLTKTGNKSISYFYTKERGKCIDTHFTVCFRFLKKGGPATGIHPCSNEIRVVELNRCDSSRHNIPSFFKLRKCVLWTQVETLFPKHLTKKICLEYIILLPCFLFFCIIYFLCWEKIMDFLSHFLFYFSLFCLPFLHEN